MFVVTKLMGIKHIRNFLIIKRLSLSFMTQKHKKVILIHWFNFEWTISCEYLYFCRRIFRRIL